jgi:dTDP-4-amino-4,6-dideoxygalactose transaminase
VITTGDGGMITTANPDFDRKFRLWRQHSMSVPDTVRHGASQVIFESYPEVGFNFRMTDMQAAVGRVQLTRLTAIVDERRRIAREYWSRLAALGGIAPPSSRRGRTNWRATASSSRTRAISGPSCNACSTQAFRRAAASRTRTSGPYRSSGRRDLPTVNERRHGVILPLSRR